MNFVGVDLGGTSVRLVVVDEQGQLLASQIHATKPDRGAETVLSEIIENVGHMLSRNELCAPSAIGVGVTGPVDPLTGIVSNPYTLGGWPPTDLRSPFTRAFNVPVVVDNDANVALVGECWRGAGMGASRVTMVTIGTGIGVASLIDGAVQRATDGSHGEAGHMPLDPGGPVCYCGARGCWEVLASGTALDLRARNLAAQDPIFASSAQWESGASPASVLFAAASRGHAPAAREIENNAGWHGLGLVTLASTLTPDLIILSGGVGTHLELLRPTIELTLRRHSSMIPAMIPIVPAVLGDAAGAIGAAKLALDAA